MKAVEYIVIFIVVFVVVLAAIEWTPVVMDWAVGLLDVLYKKISALTGSRIKQSEIACSFFIAMVAVAGHYIYSKKIF